MPRPIKPVAALFGLAGLCLVVAGGAWIARGASPDAVLARDFRQALSGADVSWSTPALNVWLSSLDAAGPNLGKDLSLGDTITISGRDGRPDRIEVTSIEPVDGDRLGLPGLRFQLVTGQSIDQMLNAQSGPQVRFLFAVDAAAPTGARPGADRVL